MAEICMICIYVADMDEAIRWYQDMLGFSVSSNHYHYPVAVDLDQGGIRLLLHQAQRPVSIELWKDSTITLGIRTSDIRRSLADLKGKGVELIHTEPQRFPAGEWAAFRDPFGNVLELIQFEET